jgi:DNA repair protein RadA/Sms
MVLAVVQRRLGASALAQKDTYVATVGGVRLTEPSVDLAVALAVTSAASDKPLPTGMVALGEVGLAGEVRRVQGVPRRLAEAARLGFDRAIVPTGSVPAGKGPEGIAVFEAATLADAVRAARLVG